MRELIDGMFTEEHVINGSRFQDYEGKVLVIKPDFFNEWSKEPENQLFLASCGVGCSPSAVGTAVFGMFLSDGEKARLERNDFLGVLDEDCMPDWAKIKLLEAKIKKVAAVTERRNYMERTITFDIFEFALLQSVVSLELEDCRETLKRFSDYPDPKFKALAEERIIGLQSLLDKISTPTGQK